ncbi:MAG: xylanase, partial [Clostridia bacterium]|nr:xylanase [Clostridia bacterium]
INGYHPMKKAEQNQIKVACVGDSITYGCMVKNRNKNNYPALLNGMLGEKYCVNNFGYTNRTAIKSGDYPFVNEKTYRQSLEFNPDIVVFLLGSNDSKENNWDKEKFINDYTEIIDSYLSLASSPKLYVLIPPPMFDVGKKVKYRLRKDVTEDEICPAIEQIAKSKGIETIDLQAVFKNRKDLFADGVHPNAEGCKVLAQSVFNAITENSGGNG